MTLSSNEFNYKAGESLLKVTLALLSLMMITLYSFSLSCNTCPPPPLENPIKYKSFGKICFPKNVQNIITF